jgi:hypothetical protein
MNQHLITTTIDYINKPTPNYKNHQLQQQTNTENYKEQGALEKRFKNCRI